MPKGIAQEVRNNPHMIGYRRNLPAGGQVIVLGFQRTHSMHEHEAMIRNALVSLGMRPQHVESSNPILWTSLRSDGERSMLFVINLLSSPMEGQFCYRHAKTGQFIDTGPTRVPG